MVWLGSHKQFKVPQKTVDSLNEIEKMSGRNHTESIIAAVNVLEFLGKSIRNGDKFLIVYPNGEKNELNFI